MFAEIKFLRLILKKRGTGTKNQIHPLESDKGVRKEFKERHTSDMQASAVHPHTNSTCLGASYC